MHWPLLLLGVNYPQNRERPMYQSMCFIAFQSLAQYTGHGLCDVSCRGLFVVIRCELFPMMCK